MKNSTIKFPKEQQTSLEQEAFILELQRLLSCYQLASAPDKNVVWAVLNKYAPQIDI